MPADEITPGTEGNVVEQLVGAAGEAEGAAPVTPVVGAEGDQPTPEDELSDWAKTELKKVRGEAANYRTKLREIEARFKDAKTPEEFATAQAESAAKIAELEHDILRTTVATTHKLPTDLAALLKGETEEQLVEHAKVLAKYAPTEEGTPEHLGGGLDPSTGEDEDAGLSPRELAAKYSGRRR